jgi:hypothetical protein
LWPLTEAHEHRIFGRGSHVVDVTRQLWPVVWPAGKS